jgi:hypothetical protein
MVAAALSGCAGTLFGVPIAGSAPRASTDAGFDPEVGPQTPEDRAELVLDTTARACERDAPECAERERVEPHLPLPDAELPASQRYYVATLPQQVMSVGFELRWDPGTRRYEIERGNTLGYPSNQDPGGGVPGGVP